MGLDIVFMKKKMKEIGYFRKVNFLVKFFESKGFDVEHQTPLSISKEDVLDLLSRCNKVIEDNSKAKELLPTMHGFFFGSTDYDEYYYRNVKRVKEYIENTLLPEINDTKEDEKVYFTTWY